MKRTNARGVVASSVSIAVGTAFGFVLAASPALAQQPVERVEITGSSIKRIDAETAVPVQIITREEIEKTGSTNLEQFLQGIGVALQGNNNTVAGSASGATTGGVSGISLRGLGSQRTLVLIDGKRVAGGGTLTDSVTVDVNLIPIAAIERVEVLRDGASAIYGSDAIGGVINFILRKDYKGGEVTAFVNVTQHPHGGGEGVSALLGWGDFVERRFNATLVFDARHDDALYGRDRKFSSSGINIANRNDTTSGNTFPANVTTDPNLANRNPSYPTCPGPYAIFSPLRLGSCRFDPSPLVSLLPKTDQTSVFGTLRLKLTNEMEGYSQFSYAYKESRTIIQPVPISDQFQLPPNHPLFNQPPYFIAAQGGGFDTFLLRSTSPYYPTPAQMTAMGFAGTPDLFVRYRSAGTGNRDLTDIGEQKRLVLGVKGALREWDYDASFLHIDTKLREHVNNGFPALTQILPLLNSGNVNPFGPNNPALTPGTPAALEATQFRGDAWKTRTSIDSGAFKVGHDLFKLAGGPLALALGTEFRREGFRLDTADSIAIGDISGYGGNFLPVDKTRNVKVAFGEVSVPIVRTVELTGAVRWDDYEGVGSKGSPKFGARWQPTRQFLVRGSVGKGFRAPSLTELYQPRTTGVSAPGIDDPLRCPTTNSSNDCGTQFPITIGGSTTLKPEISTNKTLGFVFEPVTNLSLGVDLFDVRLQNTIIFGISADTILTDATTAAQFASFVTRAAPDAGCPGCPGRITNIDQTNLNLGETHLNGFDTDIRYRMPAAERGVFTLGLQGTYFNKYDQQSIFDQSFSSINGQAQLINNGTGGVIPRWRHFLSLDWRLAPWNLTLVQQYQSGYKDLAGNRPPFPPHHVGDYSLFHLYGSYTLKENLRLTLGIRNLFDKNPPYTNVGGRSYFQAGYDPGYADPRGRMFLLQASYKFR